MQKAIGIMVLAALGWADDVAYPDLEAYPKDRFLFGSLCMLDQPLSIKEYGARTQRNRLDRRL